MGKISTEKLLKKLEARNVTIQNVYTIGKIPVLIKCSPGFFVYCDIPKIWTEIPRQIKVSETKGMTKTFILLKEFVNSKNYVVFSDDKIYLGLEDSVKIYITEGVKNLGGKNLDFIKGVSGGENILFEKENGEIFPCYLWSEFSTMIDNPLKDILTSDSEQIKKDFSEYISEKIDQEYEKICKSLKEGSGLERLLFLQNILAIEKLYS